MNVKYYSSRKEAKIVLEQMKNIAYTYGHCTVADLMDIYEHRCSYTDTKRGWTVDDLKKARVRCSYNQRRYYLDLPKPSVDESSTYVQASYAPYNPKPEPQSLNIVLHTNEVSDPDEALAKLFQYIYTIKDRMINLSIM